MPNEIQALDHTRRALIMALQGYDLDAIASELNSSKDYIRTIIANEVGDLTLEVQSQQERLNVITHARLEHLFNRLEKRANNKDIDNKSLADLTKTQLSILKMEQDLYRMKPVSPEDSESPNGKVVTTVTITADSDIYERAWQNMKNRLGVLPDDMPWLEAETEVVVETPHEDRLEKLEKRVNDLTPDPPDRPEDG